MTPELSDHEFELLRRLIYERSGINLTDHKRALVRARLSKRVRALGLKTFKEYHRFVREAGPSAPESLQMVDAISTNLTQFFREPEHFEYLKTRVFPRWQDERTLRILSAGCSTGEEPYTIAMTAFEHYGNAAIEKVAITAVDISTRALQHARFGVYTEERIKALPSAIVTRYFVKGIRQNDGLFRVKPELQTLCSFSRANLMEDLKFDHAFHAIFCRNVAIYFDSETQSRLAQRFYGLLRPKGTLFVGHSESLLSAGRQFKFVQPAVYERGDV